MRRAELSASLLPLNEPIAVGQGLQAAAVLLGLVEGTECDDASILAIERSAQLKHHAGQIAFPGGKYEAGDASLLETALREAHEEIGLPPSRVRLLGRLSAVPTPSGYWIIPFVGNVDTKGWHPKIDPGEVERILELPLSALTDPKLQRFMGTREYKGREYNLHAFDVCEPPLWGASARMVRELLQRWALIPALPG